jgi:hypothetical protein
MIPRITPVYLHPTVVATVEYCGEVCQVLRDGQLYSPSTNRFYPNTLYWIHHIQFKKSFIKRGRFWCSDVASKAS